MSVGEETYLLATGDSLVFPADQHHVYENPGASEAATTTYAAGRSAGQRPPREAGGVELRLSRNSPGRARGPGIRSPGR